MENYEKMTKKELLDEVKKSSGTLNQYSQKLQQLQQTNQTLYKELADQRKYTVLKLSADFTGAVSLLLIAIKVLFS